MQQFKELNIMISYFSLSRGIDLDDPTVGLAFVGQMCNRESSTGLTQDGGGSLVSVVTVAAHELGHIFNMEHDNGIP